MEKDRIRELVIKGLEFEIDNSSERMCIAKRNLMDRATGVTRKNNLTDFSNEELELMLEKHTEIMERAKKELSNLDSELFFMY